MLSSQVSVLMVLPTTAFAVATGLQPLKFRADGTFQISIIEDLHLGEAPSSYGPIQDAYTTKVITSVLDAESETDFIVFNGDIISRDNTFAHNSTEYIDQMLAPVVARGLAFATLYGNHDPGYNRSTTQMLARERMFPGSRTRSSMAPGSPSNVGLSNYWLPIYASDCTSRSGCGCVPEMIIWFFDSRSGYEYQQLNNATGKVIDRPPWVASEVVTWFEAEKKLLASKYGHVPSIAFVHIPFNAYAAIANGPGIDPLRYPGMNDMDITGQAFGWCEDGTKNSTCKWGKQDIPFMRALTETKGLAGVFSAHIHGTSWCYRWTKDTLPEYPVTPSEEMGGLNICFGQYSGYGGAGDWIRGSRQVKISRDELNKGSLDTWVRLETGDVVSSVSLNETYGEDLYPVTPVEKTYCRECLDMGRPLWQG